MAEKYCFVISPIGDPGTQARRRADGVLDEIIRPALEDLGYRVERADHDKTPGVVTEAIINKILDADLVVADLTGPNPNVMYELAVRHGTGKPVIHIIEEGGKLPFDIQALNTIFFVPDLAGRRKAIGDISAADTALRATADVGNPIKRTVELRALKGSPGSRSSETVIAAALFDLQSNIAQLRSELRAGQRALPSAESAATDPSQILMTRIFTDPRLAQRGISVRMIETRPESLGANGTAQGRPVKVEVKRPGWYRGPAEAMQASEEVILKLLAEAGPAPETGKEAKGGA